MMVSLPRFFLPLVAALLLSTTQVLAQASPETIRGCTLITPEDQRLACFDQAFTPPSKDSAPLSPAIVGPLLVELGDPGSTPDGLDHPIAQNGYVTLELLLGNWVRLSWDIAVDLYRRDELSRVCAPGRRLQIEADPGNPFRLVARRIDKEGTAPAFDIVWRGGNTFVVVEDIAAKMAHMGLAFDERGWRALGPMLPQNARSWTITPRSPDVLVATSPEVLAPALFLRCQD